MFQFFYDIQGGFVECSPDIVFRGREHNVVVRWAAGWAPADAGADAGAGCDSATNAAAALDQGRSRDGHGRPSGLRAIVSAPAPAARLAAALSWGRGRCPSTGWADATSAFIIACHVGSVRTLAGVCASSLCIKSASTRSSTQLGSLRLLE